MAAPTRVQYYYAHDASGATATVSAAFGSNVTAGNVIVLSVQWTSATNTLTSITQSAGTATIGTVTIFANDFNVSSISAAEAWIPVTGTGSLTLLTTLSGNSLKNVIGWEVSGADGTTPVNAHTGQRVATDANGADDPADGISPGSMTTTVDNCLILVFASGASQTLVAGTGYTLQANNVGTWGGSSEYLDDQGSAGSITPAFTRTGGASVGMAVTTIAVGPTAGAGGGSTAPRINRMTMLGVQ